MADDKQVLCYFDFDNYGTATPVDDLIAALDVLSEAGQYDAAKNVCGGFFVDNFDAATLDYELFNLYSATQVFPGALLFSLFVAPPSVSFRLGTAMFANGGCIVSV